jgi:predicted metalloprotease
LGIGGFVILLILSLVFKQDFLSLAGGGGGPAVTEGPAAAPVVDAAEEPLVLRLGVVLDSVQDYWARTLPTMGVQYPRAKLVLFRGGTSTGGCGFGESAAGPFYCPADSKVYIDLDFLEELQRRFRAPGDFAQAYILAHEIGHHVQNVTGTSDQVRAAQQRNRSAANELSVRMELQADCYAGVWGHLAARQGWLDQGDVEEGLAAAAAVGDDRIQQQTSGRVSPESWTHGSSEQRMEWFTRGFRSGRPDACETFGR